MSNSVFTLLIRGLYNKSSTTGETIKLIFFFKISQINLKSIELRNK